MIRTSANPPEARTRLMAMEVSAQVLQRALNDPEAKQSASLTRMQADAILAMQLQRLTGLEADKLAQEYVGLKADIDRYEAILADEQLILDMIRADLQEMKAKYDDPRRSEISDEELGDFDKEALIREEYMVVTVTHDGYIKRQPPTHLPRPGARRPRDHRHEHQGRRLPRTPVRRLDARLPAVLHRQRARSTG